VELGPALGGTVVHLDRSRLERGRGLMVRRKSDYDLRRAGPTGRQGSYQAEKRGGEPKNEEHGMGDVLGDAREEGNSCIRKRD